MLNQGEPQPQVSRIGSSPQSQSHQQGRWRGGRNQRSGGQSRKSQDFAVRNKERADSTAKCQWCGYEKHDHSKCPASHATCKFCQGKGHFQSMCIKKQKTEKKVRCISEEGTVGGHYTEDAHDVFREQSLEAYKTVQTGMWIYWLME